LAALFYFQSAAPPRLNMEASLVIQAELKVMNPLELKPTSPKQMCRVFY
jgi:hypothetical protein